MTDQNPEHKNNDRNNDCPFCNGSGGEVLFEDAVCRVVLVGGDEGVAFPGFCRVICKQHVREMSDLDVAEQHHLFNVVMATEQAVRRTQHPDKVNLASLGNVTPHVHWHVIPRWKGDSHFSAPIWSTPQRNATVRDVVDKVALSSNLNAALKDYLRAVQSVV